MPLAVSRADLQVPTPRSQWPYPHGRDKLRVSGLPGRSCWSASSGIGTAMRGTSPKPPGIVCGTRSKEAFIRVGAPAS